MEQFDDLNILPLKIPENRKGKPLVRPINPVLPQLDKNVILVYAPKGGGKGVMLNNLVFRFWTMENIGSLFYISPTIKSDKTAHYFREKYPNTLYQEYSDELINDIVRYQKNTPEEERDRCIVICDDCVDFSQNRNALSYLCTRARHNSITPIIASQQIRSVNKLIRNQASEVICFKMNSEEEWETFYTTYGAIFTDKKTFKKITNYAWRKKYNFLYMRLDQNPVELYANFTDRLNEKFGIGNNYEEDSDS